MEKRSLRKGTGGKGDLLLIAFASLVAFATASHYDAFERLTAWVRRYEAWQVDEVVTLLFVWTIALGVFAGRRWNELRRETVSRQRAERARIESEERYRVLVDTSPDAVTLTTLTGEIVMANRRAAEMMGFASPDLMVGLSTYDFIAQEGHTQTRQDAARLAQEGSLHDLGYTLVKADGETRFPAEASVSIINGSDGQPPYALGILRDITERVQVDQDRKRYILGLEIMHQIDQAILKTRSTVEIARAALRPLRTWLGTDLRTNVMVFDWSAGEAEVLAVEVPGEPHWCAGSRVPLDQLGSLEALRRGELVMSVDLATESQTTISQHLIQALDIHGCLLVPMRDEEELVGIISLVASAAYTFDPRDVELACQVAGALAVAIREARLATKLDKADANVRRLSRRLMEAQEMERQRLARELHDQIGQMLTAVKLNLQSVQRLPGLDGQRRWLEEGVDLVDSTIARVRSLSLDLRPSLLDDLGLVATLRWYLDREAQRADLAAEFSADPPEMVLPADVQIVAFRIAQEAITNVLRHAQAQHVSVHLKESEGILDLCIHDDGIGFDLSTYARNGARPEGLGLLGMHERAQLVGGQVRIDSVPDGGTSIHAWLPLSPPSAGNGGAGTSLALVCSCECKEECPWQPSA